MSSSYRKLTNSPEIIRACDVDRAESEHQNAVLDEALMESFPASDPIAVNFTCIRKQSSAADVR
jgi:hypothetical protein